jgi:hypothetical protein
MRAAIRYSMPSCNARCAAWPPRAKSGLSTTPGVLRPLPFGVTLGPPMSPQLDRIFQILGLPAD